MLKGITNYVIEHLLQQQLLLFIYVNYVIYHNHWEALCISAFFLSLQTARMVIFRNQSNFLFVYSVRSHALKIKRNKAY